MSTPTCTFRACMSRTAWALRAGRAKVARSACCFAAAAAAAKCAQRVLAWVSEAEFLRWRQSLECEVTQRTELGGRSRSGGAVVASSRARYE